MGSDSSKFLSEQMSSISRGLFMPFPSVKCFFLISSIPRALSNTFWNGGCSFDWFCLNFSYCNPFPNSQFYRSCDICQSHSWSIVPQIFSSILEIFLLPFLLSLKLALGITPWLWPLKLFNWDYGDYFSYQLQIKSPVTLVRKYLINWWPWM